MCAAPFVRDTNSLCASIWHNEYEILDVGR